MTCPICKLKWNATGRGMLNRTDDLCPGCKHLATVERVKQEYNAMTGGEYFDMLNLIGVKRSIQADLPVFHANRGVKGD